MVNDWRDTNSIWHSDTDSYSYDGVDRLTSASCTSWSHTYSYDKAGNRTAKDSVTYTINAVNEVTALSDGTSFTYDSNGNRTGKTKGTDTWVYTYDYANRLTKVEKNSVTLGEYIYDGDSKRIQTTENGEPTTYIYAGLKPLYEETMTGTACYIYGPAGRLAKRTTINGESNIFYYHADHLGSTRLVTDSNKNIVIAVTYHPFGESYSVEGEEDYLYTGKEKNATGLYYYGARYYDPDLGRFLTRDPYIARLVKPQSLNQYTYCYNNPLLFVDPDGRDPLHYEGPIYYGEEEKTLVYSHAPQLMCYVNYKEGYEWFAYFCIVAGIILSIASAPNLLPLLGGHLVSFAKAMAAAGPRVASAIFGALKLALKSIGTWWGHLPHKKRLAIIAAILGALLEITRSIVDHWKKVNEPLDEETGSVIYRGGKAIGTKTIVEEGPGYEVGMVMLLNDLYDDSDDVTYQYRFYQGVFWVWSDEEQDWVQQPPGWEPGDEPQLP